MTDEQDGRAGGGRTVMWRRVGDVASLEWASLVPDPEGGWRLFGVVVSAAEGTPIRAEYAVGLDADWRTRVVEVDQWVGTAQSSLSLASDGKFWTIDGTAAPHLTGCMDVDLGLTPATNALPINRLGLAVGAKAEIRVAWVLFPQLEVIAGMQGYRRLAAASYRYTSLKSGFQADLSVDPLGLPIRYGDIWERVADLAAEGVPG